MCRTTSFEASRSHADSIPGTGLVHLMIDSILWVSLSDPQLAFGRDFESAASSVIPSHLAPARLPRGPLSRVTQVRCQLVYDEV